MRLAIRPKWKRRGAVTALTGLSITMLIGFVALAVDVGMLYNVRTELQRTADAGALGGAIELATDARIKAEQGSTSAWTEAMATARTKASAYASKNIVHREAPVVDASGDVQVGRLVNPDNLSEQLSFPTPNTSYNTVHVTVHRDGTRNGPIGLLFGRVFGLESTNMNARAAATLDDRVVGFKTTPQHTNTGLLPIALHIDAWRQLLAKTRTTGDLYTYNEKSKTIGVGADGIPELNLYPGAGPTQLPPGNFGTVDIGSPNNSTADLSRQILHGPNQSDLNYFGGEFKIGSSGFIMVNGDTGLSAGIKDELEAIKGQSRTIPLFDQVSGPGNNSMFRVVAFAGIRILNVKLTGAMNSKQVVIQPAVTLDPTAVIGTESKGYYVYPARFRLTR